MKLRFSGLLLALLLVFFLAGCKKSLIAFSSNRDINFEIFTVEPDGKNLKNITESPGDDIAPDWSPDGKKIAFYSTRDREKGNEDDYNTEIYVMNADGTDQKRLTENKYYDIMPAYSLDGKKIAFCSDRKDKKVFDIYIMNSDGSDEINVTASEDSIDKAPDWLDEDTLIFERTYIEEGGYKITEEILNKLVFYKITEDTLKKTSEKFEVIGLDKLMERDLWEKDLRSELNSAGFDDEEICIILSYCEKIPLEIDHKKFEPFIDKEISEENLRKAFLEISIDKKIVEMIFYYTPRERKKMADLFSINTDGSCLTQLIKTIYKDYSPVCSPDKTKIAFACEDATGYLNLYILDIASEKVMPVTGDRFYHDETPSWSPDGKEIVFSTLRNKSRSLCIFNLDKMIERPLLDPCPMEDITPDWSPF